VKATLGGATVPSLVIVFIITSFFFVVEG
jgi:hypothetical protein